MVPRYEDRHAGRVTRRSPLPPYLSGASFHVADRAFHGASRNRLVAADMQRPFTAVRSVGLDLADVVERCRAYEPLLRPGEAFSHLTAAELFGVPTPGTSHALHLLAPPGATRARGRGVVGHEASVAVPIVLHRDLPVVAPAHVWCQLASTLSPYDLIAVGDAIVTGRRRGVVRAPALASSRDLGSAVEAWGSRRGARALASALPRVRVGAESRRETHTRLVLVDAGLPEPIPNPPVRLANGDVRHPDLAYVQWRIAFEYLGDRHRADRSRWQGDVRRRREFERIGWRVIDVTADDLGPARPEFLASVRGLLATIGRS